MDIGLTNPAGLAWLALVPVLVIPWLLRERIPRLVVPAAFLYRDLEGARHPRRGRRFRPDGSFLLKLLVLLLAILALAAPLLSSPAERAALVLDDSASLLARTAAGGTRYEAALAEARRIVGSGTAGVWDLYRLAPSPRPVLRDATAGELLGHVDRRRPGNASDPPAPALEGFFRRIARRGYTVVHVVTDRPAADAGVFRVTRVGEPVNNVAVTQASLRRQGDAVVEATIESFSTVFFRGSLVVETDTGAGKETAVSLSPGARTTETLPVPSGNGARLVLRPGDSFPTDDVVELRPAGPSRSILVVSPLERTAGLERAGRSQGFRVERVDPGSYRPAQAEQYDLVVFHRTAPAAPPAGRSLYVMPPPAPFLPKPIGNATDVAVGLGPSTHPALRYLERGALRPERAIVFDSGDGAWDPLLTGTAGALLLVRESAAVVGFDLLPFEPGSDRPTAILTLNLLTWLLEDAAPDVRGVLDPSESNLRDVEAISLPDEAASARPARRRVPLDRALLVLALMLVAAEIAVYGRRDGGSSLLTGGLRLLLIACLLAALFAPAKDPPQQTLLLDVSRSTRDANGEPPAPPGSGLFGRTFVFASEPVPADLPPGEAVLERSGPGATDLETALLEATDPKTDVVLVSDGWETRGDATRSLPWLTDSGTRIFPVPVTRTAVDNVAVERLGATPLPTAGGAVRVEAFLRNDGATPATGTLRFEVDGELRTRRTLAVPPGRQLVVENLAVPAAGLRRIDARFVPDDPERNGFAGDDVARAWTGSGETRRVLLVSETSRDDRYLLPVLRAAGFGVDSVTPADLVGTGMEDRDAVVLNGVPRQRLPADWPERLRQFVADGGGLVMIGGPQSFGPGGYRDTPVETALPVRMKPREREQPRLAAALVIDKSGSMRKEQRLAFAVESARRLLDRLQGDDRLTVIAFDQKPVVVVPLRQVADLKGTFEGRIRRLRASGGTRLYPALEEARRELLDQQARRRHVIVLSDGLSEDTETAGGRRRYYDLVLAMANQGVTISTIALGEGADRRFLERLAGLGKGAFHVTTDPRSLPDLIVGEIGDRGRERTILETPLRPQPDPQSPLVERTVRTAPSWPPVLGLVETEPKPGARIDVSTLEGDGPPLVVSWSYGRGRAVAIATDATGRWSDRWVRWEGWDSFWTGVLGWTTGVSEGRRLAVETSYEPGSLAIRLTRFDRDVPGPVPLEITLPAGGRTSLEAERVAPGHYRTALPTDEGGTYEIRIGTSRSAPTVAATVPDEPRREQRRASANRPLLERLARETGGRVLAPDGARPASVAPRTFPLRAVLIPMALLALLAETFARRLRFAFRSPTLPVRP